MPTLRVPTPPLRDDTVLLRSVRARDVPQITAACQDPDIQRWTKVPSPYADSDARGWIAGMRAKRNGGEALELAIARRDGGALLGAIGLLRLNWRNQTGEIGYWIAPDQRGVGAATAALRLFSRWALGPLDLERVELRIDPDNSGSRRVASKAGFVHEGTLRRALVTRDRPRDLAVYGLLRGDLRVERARERREELGGGMVLGA